MNIGGWVHAITEHLDTTTIMAQVRATSLLEWVAVVFAVASVLLARINSVWLYPTGIISTSLYVVLFVRPSISLFAEALLNLYYLSMSIYGWVHWLRGRNQPQLPITKASGRDWLIVLAIVAIAWAVLYLLLSNFTTSNVPLWDSWVSATACAGMWLLARRKVENWVMLNLSNLFAIPLQLYKGIPLTASLTLFLFIVAVFGYFEWRKIMKRQLLEETYALPTFDSI